jgi:hypothetical protein
VANVVRNPATLGQSLEENLGLPDLGTFQVDPVLLLGGLGLLLLISIGRGVGSGIQRRRSKVRRRKQKRQDLRAALRAL